MESFMCEKVSIIMACYNSGKTIRKAIDSILAQTYDNWLMICCDDGSTDDTFDILKAYKEQYPDKFVIIRNEKNMMLPFSLNKCLENVTTDLVARMDADDWSLPDRLEKQVGFLKEHPEYDLVGTGVTLNNGKEDFASIVKTPEPTKQTMLKENAFSHATIMTYKRVYDALGGYSLDPTAIRVEDVDLWCRFLAHGFRGYNIPDELYVVLEDTDAVKRRTLKARWNDARTRSRGYRLMGFGITTYIKPYFSVLKSFIPTCIYKKLHAKSLKRKLGKRSI